MTKDKALKMAIEALEIMGETYPYRPPCLDWEDKVIAHNRKNKALNACKDALAQPEQEPVAWQWLTSGHMRKKIPKTATPEHWQPLYSHPAPAKEWVGLSYEEADGLITQYQHAPFKFVRAIEQSLKERNHG